MNPIELIESAKLAGVKLAVNANNDLVFSAPAEWFDRYKHDLARHRDALVLLLKFRASNRADAIGKILPFRRKQDGQAQTETKAEIES